MADKKLDYGDGSGLKKWEYSDTKRQCLKLQAVGNVYAIPALKALELDITFDDVISQIKDRNHALDLYRQKHLPALGRQITDMESEMLCDFLNDKANKILAPIYSRQTHEDTDVSADAYGRYLVLVNDTLKLNNVLLTQDKTKRLETPEEHKIWDLLCQTCDCLNTLFAGRHDKWKALEINITINQDGNFVPVTPIYDSDFGKIAID